MKHLLLFALLCFVGAVLAQVPTETEHDENTLRVGPVELVNELQAFFPISNIHGKRAQEGKYNLNVPLGPIFDLVLDGEGDDTLISLPKQLAQQVYDALRMGGHSAVLFTAITPDLLNYGMSITLQPGKNASVTIIMNADYGPSAGTSRSEGQNETTVRSEASTIIRKLSPNFVIPETLEFHNNDFLRDFEGLDKEDTLVGFALEKQFPSHKTSVVSYKNNNATRAILAQLSERLDCDYKCTFKWDIDRDFPPRKVDSRVSTPLGNVIIQKRFLAVNRTPLLGRVAGVYRYQFSNPSNTYQEAFFYVNGPALLVNCTVELGKGKTPKYKSVTRKRGLIEYNNIRFARNQTAIYLAKLLREDNVVSHQFAIFMEPRSNIVVNLKFFNKNTQRGGAQVDIFPRIDVLSVDNESHPSRLTERLACPDSEENDDRVDEFAFYSYSIYRSTRKSSVLITSEPYPEAKDKLFETEFLMTLFTLEGLC